MRKAWLILAIMIGIISCKKDESAKLEISGTWQWQQSVGGFTGSQIITPLEGKTVTLILTDNKIFKTAVNGEIKQEGNYDLQVINGKQIVIFPDFQQLDGLLFLEPNGESIQVKDHQLLLTDHAVTESFTHHFHKAAVEY